MTFKAYVRKHEKRSCKGEPTDPKKRIIPDESGRYPCKYCNMTFLHKEGAKRHMKDSCKGKSNANMLMKALEKGKFPCKNCNGVFCSKKSLKRHEEVACFGVKNYDEIESQNINLQGDSYLLKR